MAGFHAKCIGMLGDSYNRDKELVAVSYIKIEVSSATQGREWCHLVAFFLGCGYFQCKTHCSISFQGIEHSLLRYLIQILVFEVAFIKTQKIKHPVLNIWCSEACLLSRTPNPLATSLKFVYKTWAHSDLKYSSLESMMFIEF